MTPHIFVLLLTVILNDGRIGTMTRPFATSGECHTAAAMVIGHAKLAPPPGLRGITAGCIDVELPIKLDDKPSGSDRDVEQPKGSI